MAGCRPLAALAAVAAVASVAPPPLAAERVTFATLNIAYATHASLEQIAAAIRALDADVVALQEVDRFTRRSPTDQAAQLGRLLDMEVAYAPAIDYQGGEFGIALLSRVAMKSFRLPILDTTACRRRPDCCSVAGRTTSNSAGC